MTDQSRGTMVDGTLSRRRLLRAAGGCVGAATLGIAATPASATDCPQPPRHWGRTEWPESDRLEDPMALVDPADERSLASWKLLLTYPPSDDVGATMARQLLAARLNFQLRPAEDPDCVDRPMEAYGGYTVRELVRTAHDWLVASSWPGDQREWIVGGVASDVADVGATVDGEPVRDALAAFNHGRIDSLSCGCFDPNGDGATADGWAIDDPTVSPDALLSEVRDDDATSEDATAPWDGRLPLPGRHPF